MNLERLKERKEIIGILLFFFLSGVYVFGTSAPSGFPEDTIIEIRTGVSLETLAKDLKEDKVIRSPFWFRTFAIMMGGERSMKAGEYYLPERESTYRIAWRVLHADYQLETVRITIPEGFTVKKISALMDERFPLFDNEFFEKNAREGYLFPDTYFIKVSATASSTLGILESNFEKKIEPYLEEIEKSKRSLEEIIIMASIIEGEARKKEEQEIISGILWKRLERNMPLQVDAVFMYLLGKASRELSKDDLAMDSPYNTYTNRGLPPGPISNPGLSSILAALRPQSSPYLFYLHGKNGQIYYARTFEEHVSNKRKYLY